MQRDMRQLSVAMHIPCVSDHGDFMIIYTCQNTANCHLPGIQSTIPTVCLKETTHAHLNKGMFSSIRPQAG